MAASANQNTSQTAGDDRNLVTIDENYLAPTLEDRALIFWEKHGRTITAVIVVVAVGLVARWAFDQFAERRERAISSEYAQAKDSAALRTFAAARPAAPLAGVALLRLADEAYSSGDFAKARAEYEQAAKALARNFLGDRARLGAALSLLQAGDAAAAKTALENLANDTAFSRTLRGEAGYHLAMLARDEARFDQANKWIELVLAADPSGLWAQRSMQLRANLPASPAPVAPAADAPAASQSTTSQPAPATVSFPAAK